MHRIPASSFPTDVHSHASATRATADFGTCNAWSAAAATTTKRSSKRTARHLGTETT